MADEKEPSGAEKMFGDFAPGLVHFTDDVLFGEVWKRPQLSPRDRSLITVAALLAGGNAEQLTFHLQYAKDNGATEDELTEVITHLAFYAGWPKAFSAMTVAKQVFAQQATASRDAPERGRTPRRPRLFARFVTHYREEQPCEEHCSTLPGTSASRSATT